MWHMVSAGLREPCGCRWGICGNAYLPHVLWDEVRQLPLHSRAVERQDAASESGRKPASALARGVWSMTGEMTGVIKVL
jgi:hypothetical protein